jgi:hypothetical protein
LPLVGGAIVLVMCIVSTVIRVRDMPRVDVPGGRAVKLDGGTYLMFAEGTLIDHGDTVRCSVRDAAGAVVEVVPSRTGSTYYLPWRAGKVVLEIHGVRPGEHRVDCTTDGAPGVIAIGRNVAVTVVIGVVAFILGLVGTVLALWLVTRRRAAV